MQRGGIAAVIALIACGSGRRWRSPRTSARSSIARAPLCPRRRGRTATSAAWPTPRGRAPGSAAPSTSERQRPGLRDLARALAHDAGVAVWRAARAQLPSDGRAAGHATPSMAIPERRARRPRHPDGCDRPFRLLPEVWGGQGDFPADRALYYGGFTEREVKPTPDSPLQAWHRQGAADHHQRRAAGCAQFPRRRRAAAAGPADHG